MPAKKSKKTVRIFALASFLNDLGSDMIYPVWPLFVTGLLGANMAILGFLDGLGDALVAISQALSGYLSDRLHKRKIFVWLGYLFGALSRIGYALSTSWPLLLPFRILDRSGKIRGAPRDAIIADISDDSNRGHNFGVLRMMDNLGAVTGIIVCIFLFEALGYKTLFLLAAIPTLLGVLLIFFTIRESRKTDKLIYKGFTFRDLSTNFRYFLLLSAIFALGSFSYSFLLLYATHFNFTTGFIPVLYLIFTAVASLVSLPFGKLSDKIGRKNVLLLAFLFWGLVCLLGVIAHKHLIILGMVVFYGLHKGAVEPVQKALVAELAPAAFRASAIGTFQMVVGFCALPASLLAGLFWDKIGIEAPFLISLGLTVLATGMLFFMKGKGNKASA